MRALGPRRVHIPSQCAGVGKEVVDRLFDHFCAQSEIPDAVAAAGRAPFRTGTTMVAVVAQKGLVFRMVRQGRVAAGARGHVAAVSAHDKSGAASPVQEQNGLLSS